MKVLVYDLEKNAYVWKKVDLKAKYNLSNRIECTDGSIYKPIDIMKIKGDVSSKYVICSKCGELVKRDELEKHYEKQEMCADCIKCNEVRLQPVDTMIDKIKLMKDGSYVKTTKAKVVLKCGYTRYSYTSIANMDTVEYMKENKRCKYFRCRNSITHDCNIYPLDKYPNINSVIPTIKAIDSSIWSLHSFSSKSIMYRYKKTNIYAVFNRNGVLDKFFSNVSSESTDFIYSPYYDLFFSKNGRVIRDTEILFGKKYVKAMESIKAMYKEA